MNILIINVLCLLFAMTVSSSVTAFAEFTSYLSARISGLEDVQTIVIDGHAYSTEGLPTIRGAAQRMACTIKQGQCQFQTLAGESLPVKSVYIDETVSKDMPLIEITKQEGQPAKLGFRKNDKMTKTYQPEKYATHPLIAKLIQQLGSEDE